MASIEKSKIFAPVPSAAHDPILSLGPATTLFVAKSDICILWRARFNFRSRMDPNRGDTESCARGPRKRAELPFVHLYEERKRGRMYLFLSLANLISAIRLYTSILVHASRLPD